MPSSGAPAAVGIPPPHGAPKAPHRESAAVRAVHDVVRAIPGWIKAALVFLAGLAAALAATTLSNRRRLHGAERRALTDALTGLANHGSINSTLRRMVANADRTETPLSAVLFDLDHFKAVNDTHGHAKGDDVLASVGRMLMDTVRASDFPGRYGGEEFVVLLPDTDREGAVTAAEKLRESFAELEVAGLDEPVTASFGVAVLPADATDAEALLRAADEALYSAKASGRNRVEVACAPALAAV